MPVLGKVPPRFYIRKTDNYHAMKIAIQKLIKGRTILSRDEIIFKSISIESSRYLQDGISGIYFLVDRNKLTYVGRSADIKKRISQHIKYTKHFNFNTFHYIRHISKKNSLKFLESFFIDFYNPPMNKQYSTIKARHLVHYL